METTSSRKRPENNETASDKEEVKRPCADWNDQFPAIPYYDDDVDSSILIEEETVNEVMKQLEEEITCPYSRQPSANLTHTGNEESCGPSFSNTGSSVMASIDMGGSSLSYFYGASAENELSALSLVSPVTDSGIEVVGNAFDACLFPGEQESWFFEEDNFWVYGMEASAGNDLVGGGGGGDGGGDKESEQEWLACALNGALFEFEE